MMRHNLSFYRPVPLAVADNANGRKSVLVFDPRCAFAHEYQNCVSVWGIINTLSKLQILIFIIRIGNLLISSLYGATETFASWFEMAFKHCVLEVTFHVNGLDLTYANIWQTSFTDIDIKQWLRRFPEERYACKYDRELVCD